MDQIRILRGLVRISYCDRLHLAISKAIFVFDRPTALFGALLSILTVHSILLGYSAYVKSPTHNEPGHLVAGLYHWKTGNFSVYSVNPPLIRMVSALPVLLAGVEEDWRSYDSSPGARPEFDLGERFVLANGERTLWLTTLSRWACIPFSWIGAGVCYLWARDLYGRPAGLLACAIWCFEPNIIGYASVIAPDAHATALGLAACYTFWLWLRHPSWRQAALTGVLLGLAELAKTTFIVLFPLWPVIWLLYRWPERSRMTVHCWVREAGMLALRMLVAVYVLNAGYGFEGTFARLRTYEFVSDLLTDRPEAAQELVPDESLDSAAFTTFTLKPGNRFANTWIGALPIPLPKNYLVGIDLQQRDFEHYARPSYLRGLWRNEGWWYYYAYAVLIKIPLALWLLASCELVARLGWTKGRVRLRDELVVLLPAAIVFALASLKTGINEHMRYVLPAFPFGFIWISSVLLSINTHADVHRSESCKLGGVCQELAPRRVQLADRKRKSLSKLPNGADRNN